jgi:FtsH-binding integral membrane protein
MTENGSSSEATVPSLRNQLSVIFIIDDTRLTLIRATYINLAFAVAAAIVGAQIGAGLNWLTAAMTQWYGAIAALVVLNVVPTVALALRRYPMLGFAGLLLDGFVSGLILGPLIGTLSSSLLGRNILTQAVVLTIFVFISTTYMVFVLRQTYSAPRMLVNSLAIVALSGCVLGLFYAHTLLQVFTTIVIGALGVVGLVSGTSAVLEDEAIDDSISGALMLFAAIFNVFIACVRLLSIFSDDE